MDLDSSKTSHFLLLGRDSGNNQQPGNKLDKIVSFQEYVTSKEFSGFM